MRPAALLTPVPPLPPTRPGRGRSAVRLGDGGQPRVEGTRGEGSAHVPRRVHRSPPGAAPVVPHTLRRTWSRIAGMAVRRPRSEVVIAIGIVAFIGVAFVKPWGSSVRPAEVRPTASSAAIAPTPTATAGPTAVPTPSPIGAEQIGATFTWVPVGAAPLGLVEADGELWFAADGGHLIRIDTQRLTATEVALDPKRFSGKVGLAGVGTGL